MDFNAGMGFFGALMSVFTVIYSYIQQKQQDYLQHLQQIYQQDLQSYQTDYNSAQMAKSQAQSYAHEAQQQLSQAKYSQLVDAGGIGDNTVASRDAAERRSESYAHQSVAYNLISSLESSDMSKIRNEETILNEAYNSAYDKASSLIQFLGVVNSRDPSQSLNAQREYYANKAKASADKETLGNLSTWLNQLSELANSMSSSTSVAQRQQILSKLQDINNSINYTMEVDNAVAKPATLIKTKIHNKGDKIGRKDINIKHNTSIANAMKEKDTRLIDEKNVKTNAQRKRGIPTVTVNHKR